MNKIIFTTMPSPRLVSHGPRQTYLGCYSLLVNKRNNGGDMCGDCGETPTKAKILILQVEVCICIWQPFAATASFSYRTKAGERDAAKKEK